MAMLQGLYRRLINWKYFIFPPILIVCYYALNYYNIFFIAHKLFFFFLLTIIVSIYGYWLNDNFDIKLDEVAKKRNFLAGYSLSFRLLIPILLLSSVLLIWLIINNSRIASLFLILEILFLSLYSAPPFRWKNHPLLGPLMDTHYSHVFPVFITIFYLELTFKSEYLLLIYFLLFLTCFRNILIHQLDDRKNDRLLNLKSFPLIYGSLFTVKIINIVITIEFLLLLLLSKIFSVKSSVILSGFLIFIAFYMLFFSAWKFVHLSKRELQLKFFYFLNDFYEIWLPVLIILSLFVNVKLIIALLIVHICFFRKNILLITNQVRKIFQNISSV